MSLRILKEHRILAVHTAIVSVQGIALLLSTIALSLPYYNSLARAQTKIKLRELPILALETLTPFQKYKSRSRK